MLALVVSKIFPKIQFCDSEVGDGSGGVNAICSRPDEANDVVSGQDVDFPDQLARLSKFLRFQENQNQP